VNVWLISFTLVPAIRVQAQGNDCGNHRITLVDNNLPGTGLASAKACSHKKQALKNPSGTKKSTAVYSQTFCDSKALISNT